MIRSVVAGLVLATTMGLSAGVSAQDAASFFTSSQMSSGKAIYTSNCASCHGGSLEGTNDAPALSGANFAAYWPGKTVADLYDYAHDNMPPTAPASLSAEQYLDIVAFILSGNGHQPGDTPLPTDHEALEALTISE